MIEHTPSKEPVPPKDTKHTKPNFLRVLLSHLKIGIIGFGGGAALFPVIENELVERQKWTDKESFDYSVVVASVSPASPPVSICAMWSKRFALLAAYAYALPGTILALIIATGFTAIGTAGMRYISFASVGIIAFIMTLLYSFIKKSYAKGILTIPKRRYLLLVASAFVLMSGNSVRRFIATLFALEIDALPVPFFSINILTLLLMAFFVIFFMGSSTSKPKLIFSLALAGLYALSNGMRGYLSAWSPWLLGLMGALSVISIGYTFFVRKQRGNGFHLDRKNLRNIGLFALVAVLATVIAWIITGENIVWSFSSRVLLSAFSSFGGGQAYIGVADAFFVQTGIISPEVYTGRIIVISSAMPGPVLMNIAAGIGFTIGSELGGAFMGWVLGLMAFFVAVSACGFGCLVMRTCFDIFKEGKRLNMVIQYVVPLICGMLVSVAIMLLNQTTGILAREGVSPLIGMPIMLAASGLILLVRNKFKVKEVLLLLAAGLGSFAILAILF